ncbi:MBL fold metallo-hydrolase [Rosistilla oblonga]|uniref:MBL fold metallo-hydrolase n=1 Tax=Rosistilla oblonga TaxID=2527990 RepID=UPI003A97E0D4
MKKKLVSTDFSGQMIMLGTGTSVGVPAIGCGCDVCQSPNPKNNRTRCSVILGLPEGNLLIDTPPDLREQLLRERIGLVHAVAYTHEHADHLYGLDDLRLFPFYVGHPIPIYSEPLVQQRIYSAFDYAFADRDDTHPGARPSLTMLQIGLEPFDVLGSTVTPIRLRHGPHFDVLGFRVGNVAYCTDTNEIPDESWPLLEGLDVLVIDALRYTPHATHFSVDQAIEVARKTGAKQTYLTHICHELDHDIDDAKLPPGINLAYDGMRIPLT